MALLDDVHSILRLSYETLKGLISLASRGVAKLTLLETTVHLKMLNFSAMIRTLVIMIALLTTAPTLKAQDYGHFEGDVVAKWDKDGRVMTLTEPFAYISPTGVRWDAPKGSKIDGASIPRVGWSLIGGPFEGKYRDASVIHDVACDRRNRPWKDTHLAFYTAMLASGVEPSKAKMMYSAVYHFGPRWYGWRPETPDLPQTLTEADFKRLTATIESRENTPHPMTLEEIQTYR